MLITLSWDKNWDSHSLVNGYPSFYPRIALVAPSPESFHVSYHMFASNIECVVILGGILLSMFYAFLFHAQKEGHLYGSMYWCDKT